MVLSDSWFLFPTVLYKSLPMINLLVMFFIVIDSCFQNWCFLALFHILQTHILLVFLSFTCTLLSSSDQYTVRILALSGSSICGWISSTLPEISVELSIYFWFFLIAVYPTFSLALGFSSVPPYITRFLQDIFSPPYLRPSYAQHIRLHRIKIFFQLTFFTHYASGIPHFTPPYFFFFSLSCDLVI